MLKFFNELVPQYVHIFWKHVKLFEMNLMNMEYSKQILKQCNNSFSFFNFTKKS